MKLHNLGMCLKACVSLKAVILKMPFLSVCYRQTVHFERKEQKRKSKRERGKQRFYNTEKAVWEH